MIELSIYETSVLAIGAIVAGIWMLVKGGDWTIDAAVAIAQRAKLSPMFIGATIVALRIRNAACLGETGFYIGKPKNKAVCSSTGTTTGVGVVRLSRFKSLVSLLYVSCVSVVCVWCGTAPAAAPVPAAYLVAGIHAVAHGGPTRVRVIHPSTLEMRMTLLD